MLITNTNFLITIIINYFEITITINYFEITITIYLVSIYFNFISFISRQYLMNEFKLGSD